MTKITNFGSREHSMVSSKVVAALATLEKELGVKFETRGGQYGNGGYIRLGVEVLDTGNGKSAQQAAFERNAHLYGLKPEWFGKEFYEKGTAYKIVGVNPGSPKYAMQIERVADGKTFKATPSMCKRGLEAAVAAGRI